MKTLLAIGTAACNVVKQLEQHSQYECYYISNEIDRTTKYKFALPKVEGPEEYESLPMDKIHKWVSKIKKDATVFLNGGNDSTAAVLRILEKLHKNGVKLRIVYFKPEVEILSEQKQLHERTARGVLQNFARSGLFENICLICNLQLESLAGSTSVVDYFNQINHVFSTTYYMLDVFKNTKPITSTFKRPKESCRISTIGISSIAGEDNLFYPFEQETEIVYYYGINEEKLKSEENLFRVITNKIKSKITDNTRVSFGIYPTQYENDYIYAEYFSPRIQQIIVDKE